MPVVPIGVLRFRKKLGPGLILLFGLVFLKKSTNFGMWLDGLGHCAMSMHIQGGPQFFFRTGWVRSGTWPVFGRPRVLSAKLRGMECALPGGAWMGPGAAERRGAPLV